MPKSELPSVVDKTDYRYASPFDQLPQDFPTSLQNFSGNASSVLSGLKGLLDNPDTEESKIKRVFLPPRLVWAAANYKIRMGMPESEKFMLEAIKLAMAFYEGSATTSSVDKFTDRVENEIPDFQDQEVSQVEDSVTWWGSSPHYSDRTARKMLHKCGYGDVLLIALGQGGVAAGMDVFLRYRALSFTRNSVFYTARLSMHKVHDEAPQLEDSEIDFLKEAAKGKNIVLFDEDTSSGETMRKAVEFFGTKFEGRRVIEIVNSC